MPLVAVTIGDCSRGGGFGLRTVDLLPALRAVAVLPEPPRAVPERAAGFEPDREAPAPDPRAEVRPVVDPIAERDSVRLPDRESARVEAEVFPAMPSRYPLESHQPQLPHRSTPRVTQGHPTEHHIERPVGLTLKCSLMVRRDYLRR